LFADEAFRWTSGGGMVSLADDLASVYARQSRGVSADGSVVAGYGDGAGGTTAFRWKEGDGITSLDQLPGGTISEAFAVSADGEVVVGHSDSVAGYQAFRWTEGGGMVGLGDLAGGDFESRALATNADGSIIVGYGVTEIGHEAFIWDAINGMRNLRELLINDYGLDLTNWTLSEATGISADGQQIVGFGFNPLNNTEAWHVDLSIAAVPEPASFVLMALVAGPWMLRANHRRLLCMR
jgi:probable HAF family extracellular repeat protein